MTGSSLLSIAVQTLNNEQLSPFLDDNILLGLAECVHYQQGRDLMSQENYNEMHRSQLEHELQTRGILGDKESLSDWQLRLQLRLDVFREKEVEQRATEERWLLRQDSGYRSGSNGELQDAPEDDQDSDDEGSGGENKVIFVQHNGITMVY